jgi:hypothetical protein
MNKKLIAGRTIRKNKEINGFHIFPHSAAGKMTKTRSAEGRNNPGPTKATTNIVKTTTSFVTGVNRCNELHRSM